MGRIVWDKDGERLYETGVKHGVLYKRNTSGAYVGGVAWNGLTSVSESPEGAEANALYADDIKYLNLISNEDFKATIEAYTYPPEFEECDGTASLATGVTIGQQARKMFGLCYETTIGNDVDGNEYGRKLHLVYGCLAAPSEKSYETINDSPDAITFSWEINTTPVNVSSIDGKKFKPTALLTIDSTKVDEAKLAQLENILFGTDAPDFSTSKTYAVGDYVTYSGTVYKCKTAITTAGAWDATKWDECVDTSSATITAFSSTATYTVGSYVTYEGDTYKCTTAVSVAGSWDSEDWEEVVAVDMSARLPLPNEVATIFAE